MWVWPRGMGDGAERVTRGLARARTHAPHTRKRATIVVIYFSFFSDSVGAVVVVRTQRRTTPYTPYILYNIYSGTGQSFIFITHFRFPVGPREPSLSRDGPSSKNDFSSIFFSSSSCCSPPRQTSRFPNHLPFSSICHNAAPCCAPLRRRQ